MTCDVIRNNGEQPERYIAQVSMQNLTARFGIMIGPLSVTAAGEFPTPPAPIAAKVSYMNYILGKNIIGAIDSWEALLDTEDRKWLKFLEGNSRALSRTLFFASIMSGLFLCLAANNALSANLVQVPLESWLIYSTMAVFVFGCIGKLCGEFAERRIDELRPKNNINITRGDERHEIKIRSKNRKGLIRAFASVLLVIIQSCIALMTERLISFVY